MIEKELGHMLFVAGLPTTLNKFVGQIYKFDCEHGSHYHTLVGTIQAIEISDEGALELYVSNPNFWGKKLISIMYNNGKWMAQIGDGENLLSNDSRFFEGNFRLL